MNQPSKNDCTIRITLPADDAAVEEFFIEFRRRVRACLSRKDGFAAELLAREAMTNAVRHGCQCDPAKKIRCVFRLKGSCLTMVIEDSGEGFDWRAAGDRQTDELGSSGRGLDLIRSTATRMRFNKKGNRVTIIRQCQ